MIIFLTIFLAGCILCFFYIIVRETRDWLEDRRSLKRAAKIIDLLRACELRDVKCPRCDHRHDLFDVVAFESSLPDDLVAIRHMPSKDGIPLDDDIKAAIDKFLMS